MLAPFIDGGACNENGGARPLTKLDLFNDGLSGGDGSAEKRRAVAATLGFPTDISANSLIEAINLTVGYEEYKRLVSELFEN